MRRKDREITDSAKIKELILACDCFRIGLADEKRVYIVPLNFGYSEQDQKRTFYFHGAKEGRKMDLLQKNEYAGFELDRNHLLNEADTACDYSFRYQSVIGEGSVQQITEPAEKREALRIIMSHYSQKTDWDFPDAALNATAVFKLEVTELAAKEHA